MSEQEALIFEVSEGNFNTSVVLNSHKCPVIVEFMGVWSGPCIQLEQYLAEAAKEFAGEFVFAKVDIDEQEGLKAQYGVENIPTLKVFVDGEVARTEVGLLQENEVRDLLKSFGVFRQSDDLREQARAKHINGETIEAITLLTRAIQQDPKNTRVAMDMVQIFLDIGELEQARGLFNRLPDKDKLSDMGKSLLGQLTVKDLAANTAGRAVLMEKVSANENDYDAMFDLAICLVAEHDYKSAVDYLFLIQEKNPEYKDGAAREMIITLTNMLMINEADLAQSIRRRLGNALN